MSWNQPFDHRDSKRQMADLVETPGFSAPLPFAEPDVPIVSSLSRLLQGPFLMDGDLCDVMPGYEAIVLVSPHGEKMLMQNEGRATFHVPAGWRILVGSKPLKCETPVKRFVKVGDSVEEVESLQSVLQIENISALYNEADPFGPRR